MRNGMNETQVDPKLDVKIRSDLNKLKVFNVKQIKSKKHKFYS